LDIAKCDIQFYHDDSSQIFSFTKQCVAMQRVFYVLKDVIEEYRC